MKKILCGVLALGMVAAFAACDNGGNGGGSSTGGGSSEFETVQGIQVTQEEWNTAWGNFIAANNVTAEINLTSIEYPEEDAYYFYETHTVKIVDNKYYSYGSGIETDNVEEFPWVEEVYIGMVDGATYNWQRSGDNEAEMQSEEWWMYAYSGEYASLGAALDGSFYDLDILIEEDAYINYYSLAEYDESKGAYVIEYDMEGEDRDVGVLEIKIVDGQITNIKCAVEHIHNGGVRERNTFYYTFTYGGATIGALPAVTE